MKPMLMGLLLALLVVDCGAYLWALRRWVQYLRAQRLPHLTPTARAQALSTPEYRRRRALARLPVTLAALLLIAMTLASRL